MRWPLRQAARGFRRAPGAADQTGWREASWCAVDLELTGLNPREDEIIAIGAVPVVGGCLVLGESFYTLVAAGRAPGRASVLVHKLRSADLDGAPTLPRALDGLLSVMAGRVPVFHTSWVEEAFLGRALRDSGVTLPRAADTEALGRQWLSWRGETPPHGLGLGRLAALLSIPAETPHHALGDALTTAKAFITLASLLDAAAPQTVGSLTGPAPVPGAPAAAGSVPPA